MEQLTPATTASDAVLIESRPDLPPVGRGALATAGIAGLAYWICLFVTGPEGPSMATATAQQVRDQVTTQGTAIQGAAIAGMVGITAAVVFVAALVRQVRDRLPGSLLPEVVLSAGLFVILYQWLVITSAALTTLLPNLIDADLESADDGILQGWYALNGFTHFMGDLALVPMVLLAWAGLVTTGAGVLGMVGILAEVGGLYAFWFVGLFGYFLWILAVSVTCLLRLRQSRRVVSA